MENKRHDLFEITNFSLSCFLSYPYYSIRLLNKNNRVITWIRYTIWIILYPLGAFLEGKINLFVLFKCLVFLNFFFLFSGLIIYKSIDYYHSKRYFTLDLPNRINFAFNFATFLQIYLGLLPFGKKISIQSNKISRYYHLGLLQMMQHMWNQRKKTLIKKNQ